MQETIGETLLNSFSELECQDLKSQLIKITNQFLQSNPDLFRLALDKQVQMHCKAATEFYQSRSELNLDKLLSSIDPMAAILINIQISLVNTNLQEESYTLSRTLLPYINKCSSFTFLPEESHYIMGRFLNSLC